MQKIVQFGKVHQQGSSQINTKTCQNCLRLQAQIQQLTHLLQKRNRSQHSANDEEQEDILNIKNQLVDIRSKYQTLKKNMLKIQAQSDDLFTKNTQLEKKLALCTQQLKQYTIKSKDLPIKQDKVQTENQQLTDRQTQKKQLQVLLFVYKQKVAHLQTLTKNQSDQIVKLRQFLRKRNNLQAERHRIIEQLQLQTQTVN